MQLLGVRTESVLSDALVLGIGPGIRHLVNI